MRTLSMPIEINTDILYNFIRAPSFLQIYECMVIRQGYGVMAIISCPPVYKKNKKQVESKNLLLTILFSKLFGNLAIRYNGNS